MPMSIAGEYLYFLVVTSLYGAPLALILIAFAWRAGQLLRAFTAVAIALPLIAGILQFGFHLSAAYMGSVYETKQASIEELIGDGQGDIVLDGRFLGQQSMRPGVPANHYIFPLRLQLGDGEIEVWVPVDGAHQPGRLVLRADSHQTSSAGEPARLLLHPRTRSLNPAVVPERYFNEYYPSLDRNALGPHTLIAKIQPRSSVVIHPHVPPRAEEWRYSRMNLIVE